MHSCNRCKDFISDGNTCSCTIYTIYIDKLEYGKYWALSDADAALKFAEHYNAESEYSLFNEKIEIDIKDENGVITRYSVSAEPDINYHCKKIWPV